MEEHQASDSNENVQLAEHQSDGQGVGNHLPFDNQRGIGTESLAHIQNMILLNSLEPIPVDTDSDNDDDEFQ